MLRTLVFYIFSQLAIGGLLSILAIPPEAGKRFFRFCGLLSLCLLLIALGSGPFPLAFWKTILSNPDIRLSQAFLILTFLLTFFYVLAVVYEKKTIEKPLLTLASIMGTSALLIGGYNSLPEISLWGRLLTAVYFLLSGLFLGSTIYAMILGHWYLVVPTLPIYPLRALTRLMIFATLGKLVLLCLTAYAFWYIGDASVRQTLLSFVGIGGIFLWARLLFGLLGPLILCYMIWETVKIHSTQSATGLLYVSTILVLLGEALSRHIFYISSIPI